MKSGLSAGYGCFALLIVSGSLAFGDLNSASVRPGRNSPQQAADLDDQDFLDATADNLAIEKPKQRLDLQILNLFGKRPLLESDGFTFQGIWTVDYSKPLMGGQNTRDDATRNLLDLRFNFDPKPIFKWDGATISVDFQNQAGRNGSGLVGDAQGFDNTDADGRTQIAELWYQQYLFDNRIRFKIGKVDANTEFAFPDFGGGFINSSIGHSPTIIGLPTYPNPAVSANLFVYPTRALYAGFGAYDGSGASGVNTGSYGLAHVFKSNESAFFIAEAGGRWLLKEETLPGHFGIGGHYHNADFGTFDGGVQSGAGGMYLTAEQKLWHKRFYDKTNADGVYALFQYAHSDGNVSAITDYFGGGLTFVGPYEKDNPDSIGLGIEAAKFSTAFGAEFTRDFETDFEVYYNFQVTSYLCFKPDLQYIIHPGGDQTVDNSLVATMRLVLSF